MNLNEVLKKRLDEAAWKQLSEEFPWTLETLKKHSHKLDWERISNNDSIQWTPTILEQFKDKLDWTEVSRTGCRMVLSPECLEQFAEYWDWSELSSNLNLPLDYELIDRFIDKWDWSELIDQHIHWERDTVALLYGTEFLERYIDRIPTDDLEDSELWEVIREKREQELAQQILSEDI